MAGFPDLMFPSRAPSFDARANSMGDIFASGNLGPVLAPSTSTSRITPSGFNPGHRYSSKSILEMDNDLSLKSYLSKSTPAHSDRSGSHTPNPAVYGQGVSNKGLIPFSTNNHAPFPTPVTFSPPATVLNSVLEEVYSPTDPQVDPLPTQLDLHDGGNERQQLGNRFSELSINTSGATAAMTTTNGGLPSPGITSPTGFRSFGAIGTGSTNPADQNPPCNTLYVGNLHPNTSEEELKELFSKSVGYKRLSFRNKGNGPMCFVEFEDVACATLAMQELYGKQLSNSVKGGIRLSFSKNPLVSCINGSFQRYLIPTSRVYGRTALVLG